MRIPSLFNSGVGQFSIACCAVAMIGGCGGGPETTTVSGKITYQGNPVVHGVINFQATGARPLGGEIGADGTYQYDLPPGEYQVLIDAPAKLPDTFKEGDPMPPPGPRLVPEKYASYEMSGLTAKVEATGEQTIDFPLP